MRVTKRTSHQASRALGVRQCWSSHPSGNLQALLSYLKKRNISHQVSLKIGHLCSCDMPHNHSAHLWLAKWSSFLATAFDFIIQWSFDEPKSGN